MYNLSQDYQLRKCFLQRDQVPTQSMIKSKMTPALANIYFKSMNSKLKVIAGLEPPMKGGGTDWYIPPEELLQGRVVLKPSKKKYLSKLNCQGIDDIGMKLIEAHRTRMIKEKDRLLHENDRTWQENVKEVAQEEWEYHCVEEAKFNVQYIQKVFRQFSTLYANSLNEFQDLIFNAAKNKIIKTRKELFQKMQTKYENYLERQATMLYDRYSKLLMNDKERLKTEFIRKIETMRTVLGDKLHDINIEKYVAIEKLRNYLECQNLACRVYVGLKERQECIKEMDEAKREYNKKSKTLTEEAVFQDFEIHLAKQKEKKQREFEAIWKKKVCHVVKEFQLFVSYCLNMLPEHAEFFINIEKLMLLQLNETLENPSAESIFVMDWEQIPTPVPQPHPFYLFCEEKHKANVNKDLCPKHCTSSASQLPAIVINKRCIYAACDNFEQFTDKIKGYVYGKHEVDPVFDDCQEYNRGVPVRYTASQQLRELKLESSLLQVLQLEIGNIKEVIFKCPDCQVSHCICSSSSSSSSTPSKKSLPTKEVSRQLLLPPISTRNKKLTRDDEMKYEREPKWESYMRYARPKKCSCRKMAKKHFMDHLPAYMRKMSCYDTPKLPNYEMCSVETLKILVEKAKRNKVISPTLQVITSATKEVGTQWSDHEFNYLCTCYSDEGVEQFLKSLLKGINTEPGPSDGQGFRLVGSSLSSTYITKEDQRFATDRALSLRHLMDVAPELKEIFKKIDCVFH